LWIVLHDSGCRAPHYSILLVQQVELGLGREKELSNSNVEDNLTHRGKNFQTESILGAIGDDTHLDNRTRWIHEGTSEIMTTWLESGPTPCRVLARNQRYTSSDRANGRHLQNRHDIA
jgi:hypothetical protein